MLNVIAFIIIQSRSLIKDNLMPRARIVIGNQKVCPGHSKTIFLQMPKLNDCTPMSLPIHVICGAKNGPTLCITAAIHGDEINGVEIIRRLLKKKGLNNKESKANKNIYNFIYF